MRGAPCAWPKRAAAGRRERVEALRAAWPWLPDGALRAVPPGAAPDDLLDALAAAWTAERMGRGLALTLPVEPARDPLGLRMEMVA
jgi:predicted RNase H-like nuclease